jgi:hypothetical protein
MTDDKRPGITDADLDKEVSFTYPDGIKEAAAVLDFIDNEADRISFLKALSRTLQ